MNNEAELQEKLQRISQREGETFKFDETAIKIEYSNIDAEQSSLAIKILSIGGGMLATLAFTAFLMITGLFDSPGQLVAVGLIFIGTAIWLNVAINNLIVDTLSISAYGTGYFLISMGFDYVDENTTSILFVLISIITLRITQNYILSFVSILIVNGNFLFLIINNHFYAGVHIYNAIILLLLSFVFLNEARFLTRGKRLSKLYNPLRIGLLISLIFGFGFVGKRSLFDISINNPWVSSLISIPLTTYMISIIVNVIGVKNMKSKVFIYGLSALILLSTAASPAIAGSLLIILLSFFVNYRLGLTIGIVAFIYFVSQFYYDLNFTLLTKSILLFSSGVAFLLLYLLTCKQLASNEEV